MKTSIDHIFRLYNNPFLLSPLLVTFYKNFSGPRKRNILLAYIVLPLVLNEESLETLSKSNKRSTLRTFRQRNNLAGIEERINEFRDLTNSTLQYLVDTDVITIEDDLSIFVRKPDVKFNSALDKYNKATRNLAKLFNTIQIVSIYKHLGIRSL
jgi:hypothetical protein